MSLLVVNSSNRIANGLISHLRQSNLYERIVCADLYPEYFAHKRWFQFKDEYEKTSSKTQISDIKFEDKSDLFNAIKKSTHILYVTHDYFTMVPSKLSLLQNTAKLATELNIKKFVAVAPIEHNHQGEIDSVNAHSKAEEESRSHYKDLLLVKSDLVFGNYSSVVNQLLRRISNGKNIHFSPSKQAVSPIHADNLAEIVLKLLGNNDAKGVSYLAKGSNNVDWNHILTTLEKAVGKKAVLGGGALDVLGSPLSNSFVSEITYSGCYRNMVQFINQYASPSGNYTDISSFGLKLKEFNQEYQENSIKAENLKEQCTSGVECGLKWMFG